jgi:1-phosphatidylinositol-4-phosphate 5-kinase
MRQYGMIKKIEHFWKGLSNDSSQISPVPPQQYGERFYHFIEGITMSQEAAIRETQMKEQAAAQAIADRERISSWNSSTRRKSTAGAVPPIPNYQPPPPPSRIMSPEAQATIARASQEARLSEKDGIREEDVPERTLGTTKISGDRRESVLLVTHEPVLPVVEEAAEAASTGGRSGRSREEESDGRPITPAKQIDGRPGGGSFVRTQGPPTPPKYLKPESQDSGYGAIGNGNGSGGMSRENSLKVIRARLSRESLNKQLPPLPKGDGTGHNGGRDEYLRQVSDVP